MASILILEDDDELRGVLVDVLEDQEHQVRGVPRGEQAIQLFQESAFDLLVVDIRMAGPDGLQTLSYLRQLGCSVPTLVMTGYADQSDPIRALRLGAKDYLLKPFALDEFLWAIERILEEQRNTKQEKLQQSQLYEALEWTLGTLVDSPCLPQCAPFAELLRFSDSDRLWLLTVTALREYSRTHSLPPEIPGQLAKILKNWDGSWENQEAGPGRAGALLEGLGRQVSEEAIHLLRKDHPGRFDPYLLESLSQALRAAQNPANKAGQLLELIHILLACGDRDSSSKALAQLLDRAPRPSPERIFARLGLAVLSRQGGAGLDTEMLHLLAEIQQLPVSEAAATLWKCGHWLLHLQRAEIGPLLQSLNAQARRDSRRTTAAQTQLLGWAHGQTASPEILLESLEHLLLPENLEVLVQALHWLLPRLLKLLQSNDALRPLLVRLCRQQAASLGYALAQPDLGEAERLFVARALEGLGDSAADALRVLSQDPSPQVREAASRARSRPSSSESGIPVQIMTFGGFELWVGSHKVSESGWRGSRVKHLAAYVAISPKPVHQERLLEIFWPENPERGSKGLQSALSVIRAACRQFEEIKDQSILVRESECIMFPPQFQRWADCLEFDRLLERADQAPDLEERAKLLQRAATLYKGPFLDGCFLEWALEMQSYYEQLALKGLLRLGLVELALQHWLSALQAARRALLIDPLLTQAAAIIVQSHIGSGNTNLGLQYFESFNQQYHREFGQNLKLDELLKEVS